MSRGPGRVERIIEAAFSARPTQTFATDELVALVYPGVNCAEKKHRVSVLRAADKVGRRIWWQGRTSEAPGGSIVYRNLCDVTSYVVGLRRTSFPVVSTDQALQGLADRGSRGDWEEVQPGGAFWTHVEINKAQRDGRSVEAEAMLAAHKAKYEPLMRVATARVKMLSKL